MHDSTAFGEGPFVLDELLAPGAEGTQDTELRLAALRAVADGTSPNLVRLRRPAPTAAFTGRDALLPGFDRACAAATARGFTPVVRPVGGRFAPYHPGCLVLDLVGRHDDPRSGSTARFEGLAEALAARLRDLGADAAVGPLPREYCPGTWSVHGRTPAVKLVGSAQRQVRGAYLLSASLVVHDAAPLRGLVAEAYGILGLDVDPSTVGALEDLVPGIDLTTACDAVLAAVTDLVGDPQPSDLSAR